MRDPAFVDKKPLHILHWSLFNLLMRPKCVKVLSRSTMRLLGRNRWSGRGCGCCWRMLESYVCGQSACTPAPPRAS